MLRLIAALAVAGLSGAAAAPAAAAYGAVFKTDDTDVARTGVWLGYSTNEPDERGARNVAENECRRLLKANPKTVGPCRLVAVFRDLCLAAAFEDGEAADGWGLGFGPSRESASAAALARCRETAGEGATACRVTGTDCDATPAP